jgi:hypothetical protein
MKKVRIKWQESEKSEVNMLVIKRIQSEYSRKILLILKLLVRVSLNL